MAANYAEIGKAGKLSRSSTDFSYSNFFEAVKLYLFVFSFDVENLMCI